MNQRKKTQFCPCFSLLLFCLFWSYRDEKKASHEYTSSLFFFLSFSLLDLGIYIFTGENIKRVLFPSMSAMPTIQERLLSCCRNPINQNNDEFLLLKNLLLEINQQDKHYLIDAEDATHRAPLFHAIESGKPLNFLKQLLDFQVRVTSRILLCAIRYGNLDVLKLFHEYGADFRQTYYGISLLHECILLHKNNLISFLIEETGVSNRQTLPL